MCVGRYCNLAWFGLLFVLALMLICRDHNLTKESTKLLYPFDYFSQQTLQGIPHPQISEINNNAELSHPPGQNSQSMNNIVTLG